MTYYLPNALFYDFKTFAPVKGRGENATVDKYVYSFDQYLVLIRPSIQSCSVPYTEIPLHILGGAVIPMRANSTMTTKLLREQPFSIVVAPDINGEASGSLYIDDGVSIVQPPHSTTSLSMTFSRNKLRIEGQFDYSPTPHVSSMVFLGVSSDLRQIEINSLRVDPKLIAYNVTNKYAVVQTSHLLLEHEITVELFY